MRWPAMLLTAVGLFVTAAPGCDRAAAERRTTYEEGRGETVLATAPQPAPGGFTLTATITLGGRATAGTPLAPGVVLTVAGPLDVASHGTGDIVDVAAHFGGSAKKRLGRIDRDGKSAVVPLDPAAFRTLANSGDAALHVGGSKIPLTPDACAAFRALAARFTTQ